jgi:hypothetical protein
VLDGLSPAGYADELAAGVARVMGYIAAHYLCCDDLETVPITAAL